MRLLAASVVLSILTVPMFPASLKRHAAARAPRTLLTEEIENSAEAGPVAPGASGGRVIRAQVLLDRARFSPGEIDGKYGDDLAIAIKGFQEQHGVAQTGTIDADMWRLLNADSVPVLTTYHITTADVRGPFKMIPKDVQEQAQLKWMGYESSEEGLAEQFHCSPKLLAELNPGKNLHEAGVVLTVPNVRRATAGRAVRVVVSASKRTVTAYGAGDKRLAQYPATLGGEHDPLPIGNWTITTVQHNPWFFWDPVHYWNANPDEAKAKLPPGPNNPAGVVWMGLSKKHYGIHGTPDPGHVRHGESYGCIRLTNWDANDLSHMVRRGLPAVLEE